MINKYLDTVIYRDGGRGPIQFDCWGLVRHVRHFELGFRLLPEYGSLRNTQPKEFTKAYRGESSQMVECEPCHGAIAGVLIGNVCVHVGLVVESEGRLKVLEVNPDRGCRLTLLHKWQRDHNTVTFHND